jgi:hypothetical protein
MAIVDTDVSIASNGDIRWTGGATTNYSVLELHRFLGALADDASAINDDFVDITSDTPSERSTDNIITLLGTYNIDATMGQHLYDGSISQASGDELYSGLRVLGSVNNTDTQIQIVQNNALYDGATPFWGDQSTGGFNGDAVSGILFRCLVLSRTGGVDIDGKRIRVQARHWGDTYDFFNVTLGQGESVAALGTTPDAQNQTLIGTVGAYTHVTNTEGYQTIDLNNGNGLRPYYSQWTYGVDTSGDGLKGMWEWIKYASGNATAETLYGINGELFLGITHEISISGPTGTFVEPETVTWSGGGSGLLLGIDSTTAGTKMWIQLLTGVIPSTELLTGAGGATATSGSVTSRTVPKTFLGSYTGSLIGAYGVGVLPADLVATDTIQDLNVVTQTPPNNVTFTVSGLVVAEDRILVGPRLAGVLQIDQMASTAATLGAGTIVMQAAIPIDTPASGTIRVLGDGGVYNRIEYTSYAGSTFTLTGTLPDNVTNGANAYVSYIDKDAAATSESFTTIFNTTRDLFVRVRDGKATPIKTFESAGTLGASGGSTVASRITDE